MYLVGGLNILNLLEMQRPRCYWSNLTVSKTFDECKFINALVGNRKLQLDEIHYEGAF